MSKDNPYRQPAFQPNFTRAGSVSDRFMAYHRSLEQFVMEIERQLTAMSQQTNSHVVGHQMSAMLEAIKRVKAAQDEASVPG